MAGRTEGVIRADESYTVPEFKRRASLGDCAYRQVKKAGLRVIEVRKKRYVLGADWISFLKKIAANGDGD